MAQQMRAPAALAKVLSLLPSTHKMGTAMVPVLGYLITSMATRQVRGILTYMWTKYLQSFRKVLCVFCVCVCVVHVSRGQGSTSSVISQTFCFLIPSFLPPSLLLFFLFFLIALAPGLELCKQARLAVNSIMPALFICLCVCCRLNPVLMPEQQEQTFY